MYTAGILSVVPNDFGKAFLRETMSHTSFWLNGPEKG